jgi:hypothetical protein
MGLWPSNSDEKHGGGGVCDLAARLPLLGWQMAGDKIACTTEFFRGDPMCLSARRRLQGESPASLFFQRSLVPQDGRHF